MFNHSNGTEHEEDPVTAASPSTNHIPRILLMGPRRSGKTSIQRVVFNKMSPHETLFRLESTNKIVKTVVDHTSLCRFQIWDFPGDYFGGSSMNGGGMYEGNNGVMLGDHPYNSGNSNDYHQIHHHHLHNDYHQMHHSMDVHNHSSNQNSDDMMIMSDEFMMQQQQQDYAIFADATALIFVMDAQDEPYDHVLQNLTETVTRAYRANPHIAIEVFINKVDGELFLTDEAKYDCRRDIMQAVAMELAEANLSDVVPIAYYLTSIYDHSIFEALSKVSQKLISQLPTLENLLNVLVSTSSMEKAFLFDVASKLYICTDSSPVDMQAVELCSDMIDVVLDVSGIYGLKPTSTAESSSSLSKNKSMMDNNANRLVDNDSARAIRTINNEGNTDEEDEEEDETEASAYDKESASVIHLSNGIVLYLKEVDTMLALVCLTRAENFRKKSLINYNIACLKQALTELTHESK